MAQIIAPNQSGFIKGRLISDNILLAQEIIQSLHKENPTPNMAIKIDMAKAYDRVQWPFLLTILRSMGFSDMWINLIERCINSNWFSVMINGSPGGFFKSSRGLRQGDPLSPILFAIAGDYLSRCLDKHILGRKEVEFFTTKQGLGVSHLAYADDVIIFTKANQVAIRAVKECLTHYTDVSGQQINTSKSLFFLDDKHSNLSRMVKEESRFQQGTLPMKYLGVPLFKCVKRTSMFLYIRDRISQRIHSWSHRFLSFGCRLTLIKSTLGAIPLHTLQVIDPTKGALGQIESLLAKFFWGSQGDSTRTHWIRWEHVCRPIDEGGLGIRKLKEMVEAFGMKLWWRFRQQNSLWANFMFQKYCSKTGPIWIKANKTHSPTWRRMAKASIRTKEQIRWTLGDGNIDFWDDIWFKDEPLRNRCNPGTTLRPTKVKDFWAHYSWDEPKVRTFLIPRGVPPHIIEEILSIPIEGGSKDNMRWLLTTNGNFSMSSAWDLVRSHSAKIPLRKHTWSPGILPSVSIFSWRLIANRLPMDDKLQRRGCHLASKCCCCTNPNVETREHLFLQGESAVKIWRYFSTWFPNDPVPEEDNLDLERRMLIWYNSASNVKAGHVRTVIPLLVFWNIWLERNNVIHRNASFSTHAVTQRVIGALQCSTMTRKILPNHWTGCNPPQHLQLTRSPSTREKRIMVINWKPPDPGWIKLNVAAAFTNQSELAGGGGIIRDHEGRIIEGFSNWFQASSRMEANLKAMQCGIRITQNWGSNIWIETDSMEAVQSIREGNRGTACTRHIDVDIRVRLREGRWRITHIHKEGNRIAERLANQARNRKISCRFDHDSAALLIKALVLADQIGIPSVRVLSEEDR